jgi:hypothetical protein
MTGSRQTVIRQVGFSVGIVEVVKLPPHYAKPVSSACSGWLQWSPAATPARGQPQLLPQSSRYWPGGRMFSPVARRQDAGQSCSRPKEVAALPPT